jgi:hypothetical protein
VAGHLLERAHGHLANADLVSANAERENVRAYIRSAVTCNRSPIG